MKEKKHLEPVRDEDGIILYDPTDDYDPLRKSRISNEDNKRLQKIAREKGKVTWGDVYGEVIKNPDRFAKKGNPEVWVILNTDPTREMECVLDEYNGKFYWMPAIDPKYIAGSSDGEGNLIKKSSHSESRLNKLKNWWKHIFSFLILFETVMNLQAQVFNPDRPMIVPFIVGVDAINQRVGDDKGHEPLTEECGYVKIPKSYYTHNGKSHGIIILQTWHGTYAAVEARCPVCFYEREDLNGGTVDPSLPFSECNKCGASADNLKTQGSGQMFRYKFKGYGPVSMEGYRVTEYKRNGRLYLWVDNIPNGLQEEWKQQPENKIIVDGYRKLNERARGK